MNTVKSMIPTEQGVTCASLQFTLPGPHFVRARLRRACNGAAIVNRTHCISTRLNPAELIVLQSDARAAHKRMGALLRDAYFNGTVMHVPAVNVQMWKRLGTSLDEVRDLAAKLNAGGLSEQLRPTLAATIAMLQEVRGALTGTGGADEG
jgi:hypothetical protein